MKKLIAGNWKMNGSATGAVALVQGIASLMANEKNITERADFLVCPAFLHLSPVRNMIEHQHYDILLGAQDCSVHDFGAYTGDIAPAMLADSGCQYVIVGHSERRENHEETDTLVCAKAKAAHESGLKAIICVGETLDQRESGQAFDVIGAQIKASVPEGASAQNTVIAYEPVWAIGSGKAATPEDIAAMHDFIREKMKEKLADYQDIRILYGGSVKPENASEIFKIKNVDGALIGGASLKAESFVGIAKAA